MPVEQLPEPQLFVSFAFTTGCGTSAFGSGVLDCLPPTCNEDVLAIQEMIEEDSNVPEVILMFFKRV